MWHILDRKMPAVYFSQPWTLVRRVRLMRMLIEGFAEPQVMFWLELLVLQRTSTAKSSHGRSDMGKCSVIPSTYLKSIYCLVLDSIPLYHGWLPENNKCLLSCLKWSFDMCIQFDNSSIITKVYFFMFFYFNIIIDCSTRNVILTKRLSLC